MGQGSPSGQRFKYDTQPQAPSNGENQARRQLYRYGRTDTSRTSILRRLQTNVWYLYKMHKTKQSKQLRMTNQSNKKKCKRLTNNNQWICKWVSYLSTFVQRRSNTQARQYFTQHEDVVWPRDCASHASHRLMVYRLLIHNLHPSSERIPNR